MIGAFVTGLVLGLSCGLAPGPLLTLVLTQSLRHGAREGFKVALTPLITDLPMILTAAVLAAQLGTLRPMLGLVSIAGGVFVLYLAWESLRPQPDLGIAEGTAPNSWLCGVVTNLLSPYPWLFWLTVGATTLAKGWEEGWSAVGAFLASFYLLLVGSKMGLAWLAGQSRRILTGRGYRFTLRALGLLMVVFAVLLMREGVTYLRGSA